QIRRARYVDAREHELAVGSLRIFPDAGLDDRVPADDPVRDLRAALAEERELRAERGVDPGADGGGRVVADVELLDHRDVGSQSLEDAGAGRLVGLAVAAGEVAGHQAQGGGAAEAAVAARRRRWIDVAASVAGTHLEGVRADERGDRVRRRAPGERLGVNAALERLAGVAR